MFNRPLQLNLKNRGLVMEKWNQQIDTSTQEFVEAFGKLSAKELNWKPNSKTWSIAQNIDHLIVFNETYFSIIESLKNKTSYKVSKIP
jgi:uncharacterized damage-inducible protein DinB